MDAHLDACSACRDLVHHVVQGMAQSWHGEGHDATDPGTTFLPGNVVNGRYMILRFVGRGGMGEVYEAFDQLMDRRIALKTVLCTVADRPRAARRFKEEVRNAQRVGHRHVCRINDLQEHREAMFGPPLPFFTMEFIDGERLGNRLAAGPLPLDEARDIALQLLGGLEAAHARGVLHLDFKSDNVMLRRDAEGADAVIMDFGLSRVLGKESRLRTSDRRQFAGTLPYMSVEQLECRDVLGPATDVYAFGVVLYEMLTRTLPFDGESLGAVLLEQLKERPQAPSRHVRELSPELDRFVLKCLHNNPRMRYADAGEALVALRALGSWRQPPLRARLRRSLPWAAAVVALGIVAVVGLPRSAPSAPAAPPSATERPIAATQTLGLLPPGPATSPAPHAPAPEATATLSPSSRAAAVPPVAAAPIRTAPRIEAEPPPAVTQPVAPVPLTARAREARRPWNPATIAAPAVAAGPAKSSSDGSGDVSEGARATDVPTSPTASSEPSAAAAPELAQRAASGAGEVWRPARVPKRLSVPAASARQPHTP